jgi:hypothetical protein
MLKTISIVAVLLFSTSAAMATLASLKAVVKACRPDVKQFCNNVRAGGWSR